MLNLKRLSDSLRAATSGQTWQVLAGYSADLGFDRIIGHDLGKAGPTVQSTFDADWLAYHQDRQFARNDPFLAYCCRAGQPTATGAAYLGEYGYLSDCQRSVIRAAGDAGFDARSSVVPPDQPDCAWDIGSSLPHRDVGALRREMRQTLPLALRMVTQHIRPTPRLTERENNEMRLLGARKRVQ